MTESLHLSVSDPLSVGTELSPRDREWSETAPGELSPAQTVSQGTLSYDHQVQTGTSRPTIYQRKLAL